MDPIRLAMFKLNQLLVFPFSQDQYHKLLGIIRAPPPITPTSNVNAFIGYCCNTGFLANASSRVCWLLKSLYGLKQASHNGMPNAFAALVNHQVASDPSFFIWKTDSLFLALLLYVDNVILAGIQLEVPIIKTNLHTAFNLRI